MPRVRVVYRRSELYEQVWREPLLSVARHYGISDVALGKICRKLDVPVPGRGHWARTRAGQEIPRTPLPELKRGQPAQLQSARYTEPSTEAFGEDVSVRINKERDPANRIVVAETLADPHPLVRMSTPLLKHASLSNRPTVADRCLDVSATGEALSRALRIVDALLKALEARGMEVDVTEPQAPEVGGYSSGRRTPSRTGVRIGDTFVAFAIEEKMDAIPKPPPPPGKYSYGPRYERCPNGKLVLVIRDRQYSGERQRWSDAKRQRLEDQINDFVVALIETAESLRLKAIEEEKERQRRIADEREREAAERQRAAIAVLSRDLHRRMGAWRIAQDTRSFVDLLKGWAATDGVDGDPRLKDWLTLAEWRIEALEKKARTELLDRRHGLSYASPLRQRFRWEDKASTAALVDVVLNPYSQAVDDPEDPQADSSCRGRGQSPRTCPARHP